MYEEHPLTKLQIVKMLQNVYSPYLLTYSLRLLLFPVLLCVCVCCSGGDTIRQIQVQSGAHVELHRGAQPNPNEKLFNVRGTPQQVQVAQQLIRQKYENVPGEGGAGGPPFGHPGYV